MAEPAIEELRAWSHAVHVLKKVTPEERRSLREDAGVSRAVLADLIGVTWERIRAYESGSTPTGEDARMYLMALDAMRPPASTALDDETYKIAFDLFEEDKANHPPTVCDHCKGIHARSCPRVRRIAYNENRHVAEVEYWPEWPKDNIVFSDGPEMMDHDEG